MKLFGKLLAGAALAAAATFTATLPAAAVEYPEPVDVQIQLDIASCAFGGTVVDFRALAFSGSDSVAGTMTVTGFGETYTEKDSELSGSAKTPSVAKRTVFTVTATFVPAADAGTEAAFRTATTSKKVTLVPKGDNGCSPAPGDDSSGLLPDTGGLSTWYFILGFVLLVGGGATLVLARRRGPTR